MKITTALMTITLCGLPAQAGVVVIPATTDIWLAGQSSGSTVTGYFGSDSAPANSPIGISVIAGHILTFSASGTTSVDGSCFVSNADGGCYTDEFGFSPGPANGISLAHVPSDGLVGVFVGAAGPSGPTPAALDFTGANASFLSLAPVLDQQFFIGDGLTGTGTGSVQQFLVPTGATTLYLAVSDSVGGSTGNLGSLSATVSDLGPAPTPEPGSLGLLAAAAGGLVFVRRRRAA